MQFLALQPGVHSIHSLTLMDVETGYSMNLKCVRHYLVAWAGKQILRRSVMDVVVHEVGES